MTANDPRDYAEAIAFFNECKARRVRDRERIAELEAENERLRVCGNCKWFRAEEYQFCAHPETLDAGYDGDMPYYISAPDKCDFTPSRWATREETP